MKLSRSVRSCRGSYDWLLPEELERHMAEIVRIEDRRELCRDCTGDCRQNPKGYYDVVSPTLRGCSTASWCCVSMKGQGKNRHG
ncbi:MAG: hypothetical protein J6O13_00805 [Selenomonas sp.]|nr:hypothetical protein [Selenomonas sp.]